ncbi:glycosyltransferase family 2 protein [Janibacter cremeus]|uniref:glycosyltransferase family 2 protein n=1 Tax=Janibacter cremeus TaxID=1285192 RepID=UPI0023F9CBA9|nr:glycosyltransferase family 2 protein [Janibacter cremeus]WEV76933.1 glycosyltransferase family 2 protein [Janibacter cremeus]
MDAVRLRYAPNEDPIMIDCLLIVVSYKSANDITSLLSTVPAAMGDLSWCTLVVNNDPAEDLRHIVAAHPGTDLVESGANLGYAGGINRGLADAPPSRWVVFLNPDLRLGPGAIALMAAASGGRDAVVPTLVDDAGLLQYSLRREPSVLGALGDALLGGRWPGRPPALGEVITRSPAYASPGIVDWATGAALLVPSALVRRVGPWDADRFFLYSEETDYCRRLRRTGAAIRFIPDALVSHRGGGSGRSEALHALQEVNRVRYFHKWHGPYITTVFAGVVTLNNLLRCHRSRSRVALRALLGTHARRALPGGTR